MITKGMMQSHRLKLCRVYLCDWFGWQQSNIHAQYLQDYQIDPYDPTTLDQPASDAVSHKVHFEVEPSRTWLPMFGVPVVSRR